MATDRRIYQAKPLKSGLQFLTGGDEVSVWDAETQLFAYIHREGEACDVHEAVARAYYSGKNDGRVEGAADARHKLREALGLPHIDGVR